MKNENAYKRSQIRKGGPHFNILDFENIDKPEISYIMGLLWADGHLVNTKKDIQYFSAINLNINNDDFNNISKTLNKYMKWTTYIRVQSLNKKKQACSFIYDTRLADFFKLNEYDIKSHISPIKILKHIPAKYHYLFWRGYFDGDGCLSIKKNKRCTFNISSTYEQDWTSFDNLSHILNFSYKLYHHKRIKSKYSCVEMYKIPDILNFCKYIYYNRENDCIGLTRKYAKYLELLEINKNIKPKSSKYTGISLNKKNNKWTATVWSSGRYIYIGSFNTEDDAYIARCNYISSTVS